MEYSHRYHAYPTQAVAERLQRHLDVHRQLYNNVRWDYENSLDDDKPSEYDQNNNLPEWKRKWPVFSELHSKAAQATVARFHRNLSNLRKKKEKGYNVGRLKRQAPTDYRSVTYNQSGFDLDEKRGRDRFVAECPSGRSGTLRTTRKGKPPAESGATVSTSDASSDTETGSPVLNKRGASSPERGRVA